jgi:hypothetical protein
MALAITVELPSGEHVTLPATYRLAIDEGHLPGDLWELVACCGCVYGGRKLWPCRIHLNARNPKPHRLT